MERKPCPVDRGKLLISLECCRMGARCESCPYYPETHDYLACDACLLTDALAYINYLEEQRGAMAAHQLPKLGIRVRFPSLAPKSVCFVILDVQNF